MGKGYCGIGLDNPKDENNVGAVLRAAGVYGAAFVAATGKRFGSAKTDTGAHYRTMPFFRPESVFDLMPYDCVPVAVDLVPGAIALPEYQHPERAFYIFGAEDATLGERVIQHCKDVVYIPTKYCMNLAATVNVVLYDRMVKREDFQVVAKFEKPRAVKS